MLSFVLFVASVTLVIASVVAFILEHRKEPALFCLYFMMLGTFLLGMSAFIRWLTLSGANLVGR